MNPLNDFFRFNITTTKFRKSLLSLLVVTFFYKMILFRCTFFFLIGIHQNNKLIFIQLDFLVRLYSVCFCIVLCCYCIILLFWTFNYLSEKFSKLFEHAICLLKSDTRFSIYFIIKRSLKLKHVKFSNLYNFKITNWVR